MECDCFRCCSRVRFTASELAGGLAGEADMAAEASTVRERTEATRVRMQKLRAKNGGRPVTLLTPKRRVDGQRGQRQPSHYLYTVLRAGFTDWIRISQMQHHATAVNSKSAAAGTSARVLAFAADA